MTDMDSKDLARALDEAFERNRPKEESKEQPKAAATPQDGALFGVYRACFGLALFCAVMGLYYSPIFWPGTVVFSLVGVVLMVGNDALIRRKGGAK